MLFMAPAFLLMLLVQWYVNSSYSKWGKVPTRLHISGAQAAEQLIRYGGLQNVQIGTTPGNLTDHYDPRDKTLYLSPNVYQGASVAAVAVAAHELGHALQDKENYGPLRLRSALVPAVNIGSYLGWILIIIGLIFQITGVAWLGVLIFSAGAVFALATLPVELNASARAKQMLREAGIIYGDEEMQGVNQVLNAAALTYVAALVTAVLQLLYYVTLVLSLGGRRRD
jgi:hypothetical protein